MMPQVGQQVSFVTRGLGQTLTGKVTALLPKDMFVVEVDGADQYIDVADLVAAPPVPKKAKKIVVEESKLKAEMIGIRGGILAALSAMPLNAEGQACITRMLTGPQAEVMTSVIGILLVPWATTFSVLIKDGTRPTQALQMMTHVLLGIEASVNRTFGDSF